VAEWPAVDIAVQAVEIVEIPDMGYIDMIVENNYMPLRLLK
jgi:hypothetical protein